METKPIYCPTDDDDELPPVIAPRPGTYVMHVRTRRGGDSSYFGLSYATVLRNLPNIKADCRVELSGRTVGGVEKRRNDDGRQEWFWWLEKP